MAPAGSEAREDVRFLRDLLLRTEFDGRSLAPVFASWGIAWIVTFGLTVLAGKNPGTEATNWVLTVAAFASPTLLLRGRGWHLPQLWGAGNPGAMPLLLRTLYTSWAAVLVLAFGLIATLHAWNQTLVADGGYWLLIVGAGYAIAGALFSRVWALLGLWLLAVGIVIPLALPAAAAASAATGYAILGGGGFLAAAAWAARVQR